MLSILIPIYNINCVNLVTDLRKQCHKAGINFEILCYDDGSRNSFRAKNKTLAHLFGVSYVEMKENYGRARLRNRLARYSNGEYLLFIDADSKTPNKSFIKGYLPYLKPELVVYGGRSYVKNKPKVAARIFHWTYGTKRESRPARHRNRHPYLDFMSNNFVVPRMIFEKVPFDADHEGYGYEDTLYASRLKEHGIRILHIDNPLIHTGVENIDVFMEKTLNALENLADMYLGNTILPTRLIRVYERLVKLNLATWVYGLLGSRIELIEKKLFSTDPPMRQFDLWKLYHFMKIMNSRNKGNEIPEVRPDKVLEE